MLCHWRYVIDNLFGDVKAVSCLGATHIPQRVDERGRPYAATADDAAYATFELEGGVIAQINSSWCDARASRRPADPPGRRHAGLGRRRAPRLLDPAARGHAAARLEPGHRADDRLLRRLAEDADEPELRQRLQGAVGAVPRATSWPARRSPGTCSRAPRACSSPNSASGAGSNAGGWTCRPSKARDDRSRSTRCCRSTRRRCVRSGRWTRSSRAARATASAAFRRGATRWPTRA